MRYQYYISYTFKKNLMERGQGSLMHVCDLKKIDFDHILEISESIRSDEHYESVVIDNIIPLPIKHK